MNESIQFLFNNQTPPLTPKQQAFMVLLSHQLSVAIEGVVKQSVVPYVNLNERTRLFSPKKKLWGSRSHNVVGAYKTLVDRFVTELKLSTLNAKPYESQLKDLKAIQTYMKLPKEVVLSLEQHIEQRATQRARQSYERKQSQKQIPRKKRVKASLFLNADFYPASDYFQDLVLERKGLGSSTALNQLRRVKSEIETLFGFFYQQLNHRPIQRTAQIKGLFNLSHLSYQGMGGVGFVISALSELNEIIEDFSSEPRDGESLIVDAYFAKALEQLAQLIPVFAWLQEMMVVDENLEPRLKLQTLFDLTLLNQSWQRDCERCKLPVFQFSTNPAINTYLSSQLVNDLELLSEADLKETYLTQFRNQVSDYQALKQLDLFEWVEWSPAESLAELKQLKRTLGLPVVEWAKPERLPSKCSLAFRTLRKLDVKLSSAEVESLGLSDEEVYQIQREIVFEKQSIFLNQKLKHLSHLPLAKGSEASFPKALKLGERLDGNGFVATELVNVYTTSEDEVVWPRVIEKEMRVSLYLKQSHCTVYHWENQPSLTYLVVFEIDNGLDCLSYAVSTTQTDILEIIREISEKKESLLDVRRERIANCD